MQAAEGIQDARLKPEMIAQVAGALARAGDGPAAAAAFARALQLAKSLEMEGEREAALSGIAREQARAGDTSGALETARALKEEEQRAFTLNAVLAVVTARDGAATGLRLAEEEASPVVKAYILIGVANGIRIGIGAERRKFTAPR